MRDVIKLFDSVSKQIDALPAVIATEAVNFSKERFVQQNWVDFTTQPWAARQTSRGSKRRNRGAILVSSGRLKRSIRRIQVNSQSVTIGTDVPYAAAHNYGYRGAAQVKRHTRTSRAGRKFAVEAFKKQMNLPRRTFLGESDVLAKRIERVCTARIMQAIKQTI